MIYRNYGDIGRDITAWASKLPRFAGVCGIPRAGVVIASIIAQHQNTHLINFNDLLNQNETWKRPLRRNCPAADGPILVVDDTVATGGHMRATKEKLRHLPYDLKFGAYLGMNQGKHEVDYLCEDVGNEDHLFQFNVFHHWFNDRTLTDLDGVLCEDWKHEYETGDLADAYQNHLENAACLIRPTFQLQGIVTGRLEKYRAQTEAWLAKHGIPYRVLVMYPAETPEQRGDTAALKAEFYKKSDARLFVESDSNQARTISSVSGRDVLDWGQQKLTQTLRVV